MSLTSKLVTLIGTATAYVVHYVEKGATPLRVVTVVYANTDKFQQFAVKHSLRKDYSDAVQSNLLKCLEYID